MSRRHKVVLAIVVALFAITPFVIGSLLTPSGWHFAAPYVKAPGDTAVYYRYMNDARTSGPLLGDGFTTEQTDKVLWQPVWWILGRGAALFHVSTPLMYALSRALMAVVTAMLIAWVAGLLYTDRRTASVATWLAYFGAGLGGFFWVVWPQWSGSWNAQAYDLWVSEGYPWMSALASPHFLVVTSGLIFVLLAAEQARARDRVRRWSGPVLLVVLSIHPFHVITVAVAWLLLTLAEWWNKTDWRTQLRRRALTAAWAIPAMLYYALSFSDPAVALRAQQNINDVQWWPLLVGVIPLILLGLTGLRRRDRTWWPAAAWAVAILVASALPLDFSRRLFQAAAVPLGLLMAPLVTRWLWGGPWRRLGVIACLAVLAFSPAVVLGDGISAVVKASHQTQDTLEYQSPAFQGLVTFLQAHPTDSTILTSKFYGNLIASQALTRPYLGHSVETLHSDQKAADIAGFFGGWGDTQRRALVERAGICFVLLTPYEETYGGGFVAARLGWPEVWRSGDMRLYRTSQCE